jgi:chemotaxis protein methyltransferase CheR
VRVLATDIDTNVLETARAAAYRDDTVAKLDPDIVRKYFLRGSGANAGYVRVRPEVAGLVTFRQLNLLEPQWSLRTGFDAIFCRNVMIYFDGPEQTRLVEKFYHCLNPEGYLFVGHAESLFGLTTKFHMIHENNATVYQRIDKAVR